MQHSTISRLMFTLSTLVTLHCDDRDETSTGVNLLEAAPKPDAGRASSSLPPGPSVTTPMPPSSCGGLIGDNLCDPLTGWPCAAAAGETCDYLVTGGRFQCFPAPNTAGFCEACGFNGPGCGIGFTCNGDDWCERYCCADSDCGIGRCLRDVYGNPDVAAIGYCQEESIVTCLGIADAGPLLTPLDASARP